MKESNTGRTCSHPASQRQPGRLNKCTKTTAVSNEHKRSPGHASYITDIIEGRFHQARLNRRFTNLRLFITDGQIHIAFHQTIDILCPAPVSKLRS